MSVFHFFFLVLHTVLLYMILWVCLQWSTISHMFQIYIYLFNNVWHTIPKHLLCMWPSVSSVPQAMIQGDDTSGEAGDFAWQSSWEISEVLPGYSVAIMLTPPFSFRSSCLYNGDCSTYATPQGNIFMFQRENSEDRGIITREKSFLVPQGLWDQWDRFWGFCSALDTRCYKDSHCPIQ